jgi:hypothetical protein
MDFKYLVECKNEFNNYLSQVLAPHIFHGIRGMFKYAENVYDQIEQKNKRGAKISNPGVVNIFKKTLDGIKELNNHEIEEEYTRIKMKSGCSDFFDNLIKASFKSYVLFLTWDPKIEESIYTDNAIYDQISIKDFIHKCYIMSCEYFKENPELFYNSRANKKDIFDIIKSCIEMAIKKSLPYNQILEDYLNIEFTKKNNNLDEELANVKKLVNDMINTKKYGDRPNVATIEESSEDFVNIAKEDPLVKRAELENFISREKQNESLLETSGSQAKTSEPVSGVVLQGGKEESSDDNLTLSESESNSENGKNKSKENNKESSESSDNITRSSIKSKELSELMKNDNNSKTSSSESSKAKSLSKTSVYEVKSPPAIRAKPTDKMNELVGGKKNVEVKINKKNMLPEKFNQLDSFYDSIAK